MTYTIVALLGALVWIGVWWAASVVIYWLMGGR